MNRSLLILLIALFFTACSHPQRMLDAQNEHVYGGSREVTEKTSELTAGLKTESEKAAAIYKWITENIAYDTESFVNLEKDQYVDQSARSVLRRGTGVAVGYSHLFHAMAGSAGLESKVITGWVKTPNPQPGQKSSLTKHGWNAYLDDKGEWVLVDTCWGAGELKDEKTFAAKPTKAWFDVAPEQFAYTHFTEELNLQLTDVPLSKDQFERLPQVNAEFFDQGLALMNLADCPKQVPSNLTLELRSKQFAYVKAEVWPIGGARIFNAVEVDNGNGQATLRFAFPEPGDYEIRLRSRKPDQKKSRYVGSHFVTATEGVVEEEPEPPKPSATPEPTPIQSPSPEITAAPSHSPTPIAEPVEIPEPPTSEAPEITRAVAQRAKEVTAEAATDRDKAYAIYRYIVENVTYDTYSYFNRDNSDYPDQSADAVLQRKTAVCAGYSRLFQAMAISSGLKAEYIKGYSKKNPFAPKSKNSDSGHAWNAVKIDGQWRLVDTTWGAGSVDDGDQVFKRDPNDEWFLNSPQDFAYSHLPEDDKWQLMTEPVKKEEFENLPRLNPQFAEFGLRLKNPKQGVFQTEESLLVELESTKGALVAAGVFNPLNKEVPQAAIVSGPDDALEVQARFPEKGHYRLVLFAKNKVEDEYEDVGTLYVKASKGAKSLFPQIYKSFKAHHCRLLTGLDGQLVKGRPTSISLKVPDAKSVYLKQGKERTEFEKIGTTYQLNFKPVGGETIVQASFGEQRYEYLLKYETL